MKYVAAALGASLLAAAPAGAQGSEKSTALNPIAACRAQTDDAARLRCYDQAAANLLRASEAGTVVVLDREAVSKTRRSLFGFDIPNLPFFRSGDDEDRPKEIVAKVASARASGFEAWTLVLDNGATWQTIEPTPKLTMPRVGDQIKLKKSVTGAYLLQVGSRQIRARRVR